MEVGKAMAVVHARHDERLGGRRRWWRTGGVERRRESPRWWKW
jgi:hypothetical protein